MRPLNASEQLPLLQLSCIYSCLLTGVKLFWREQEAAEVILLAGCESSGKFCKLSQGPPKPFCSTCHAYHTEVWHQKAFITRDAVIDFSVLLPLEAVGIYSGSLVDGTKVQFDSAWLGIAVRAKATLTERGETPLLPKSIWERFSKVPASHRGKQEQTRGSKWEAG